MRRYKDDYPFDYTPDLRDFYTAQYRALSRLMKVDLDDVVWPDDDDRWNTSETAWWRRLFGMIVQSGAAVSTPFEKGGDPLGL